jgi:predicted AAA+ superfamily ATPase
MDELYSIYKELLQSTGTKFNRFQLKLINWDSRLIGITGARGVGKTTMLLQHIKQSGIEKDSLYVSADNVLVSSMGLFKLAGTFYRHGGKHLIIDEIHKYSNWSGEIKNIYDSFPNLKVILTGSSILDLYHGYGDLSRRLISYNLPGLSFREYLLFELNLNLEPTTFFDIINQRTDFKIDKPLMHFKNYLGRGYYPFYKEGDFNFRLNSAINAVLETDIPKYLDLKISTIEKLKQLMQIIAESSPFKPNLSKIAEILNISRNALPNYLSYLERAELIKKLTGQTQGIRALGKTSKVYLNNTNLMNALALSNYNLGNARETFFVNQLTWNTKINLHDKGDFIIDEKHIFEIGRKNKTKKQIRDLENAYIVKDDIEFGYGNTIPLWHFGMLY